MDSGTTVPANNPIRELPTAYPLDFARQFSSGIYPTLPPQDSALREYLRVLIKRKFTVLFCLVGIFTLVAVATLKTTPIYVAGGRIAVNKVDSGLVNFK